MRPDPRRTAQSEPDRTPRRVLPLLLLPAACLFAPPVHGQQAPDSASLARADSIRASLERPRARPSTDAVDVVEFPFKVVFFPVKVVVRWGAAMAGYLTLDDPPLTVRGVKSMQGWGLVPKIRTIGPNSGEALVLDLERFEPFFLRTGVSILGSLLFSTGVELDGEAGGMRVAYTFRRDAQDNFWGIGNETAKDQRSDFEREKQEVALEAQLRLGSLLSVGGGFAFEDNQVDRGSDGGLPDLQDTFDPQLPFGTEERVQYVRFSLSSTLDLTHISGFQRRGFLLGGGVSLFRGVGGTDSDFHRFNGDFHGYLPLNSRQSLALRGLVEINRLDDGEGIPFFDLSRLGGSRNGPRSFSTGRFTDRDGLSLMTEWRYQIWEEVEKRSAVEGFVLFDAGAVQENLSDISFSDLHASYGFGMRLLSQKGLAALSYLAFSDEGAQFVLKFEWPF